MQSLFAFASRHRVILAGLFLLWLALHMADKVASGLGTFPLLVIIGYLALAGGIGFYVGANRSGGADKSDNSDSEQVIAGLRAELDAEREVVAAMRGNLSPDQAA